MHVQLVAFGIAKDILGQRQVTFDTPSAQNVGDLILQLGSTYPDFTKLTSLRVAVNEAYVQNDYVLQDGDEVVLIPPVSGG